MNGKIVAVSALNDLFSIAVRAWVDAHGGDSSTLKLLELPTSAVAVALTSGRIDAAVMIQPFLANALAGGSVKSIGDPVGALGQPPHRLGVVHDDRVHAEESRMRSTASCARCATRRSTSTGTTPKRRTC